MKLYCISFILLLVLFVVISDAYDMNVLKTRYDDIDDRRRLHPKRDSCGERVQWELQNGTLTIKGKGPMCNYSSCNQPWSVSAGEVKHAVVEEGVTTIGDYCFSCCESLTDVRIPESVVTIGAAAFGGCGNLTEVSLPPYITSVERSTFQHCKNLRKVNIPDGVHSIDTSAFEGCGSLESVIIPDSVKSIGTACFNNCPSLKSIVIPDSVSSFASPMFAGCTNLESVTIGSGVKSLGNGCFYHCDNLKTLIISAGVTRIEIGALSDCHRLKSMLYLGTANINCTELTQCDLLDYVCVLPDYKSTSFCGKNVSSDPHSCELLKPMFNQCYETLRNGTGLLTHKLENATIWENKTNGCVEYVCLNESGAVRRSVCSSDDEMHRVCIDEQCIESKSVDDKEWIVEIDVGKVNPEDVNEMDILSIVSELSSVSMDSMKVGVELDDDGFVLRILIFLDGEENAKRISETVETACVQNRKKR